jgi:hypothetical protein
MKDKIKLVSVALGGYLFIILFAIAVSNFLGSVVSQAITPYLENSAKCESLGGKYGSGKCFVNGKEITLGE